MVMLAKAFWFLAPTILGGASHLQLFVKCLMAGFACAKIAWHEYKVRVDSDDVKKAMEESSSVVGICPPGFMVKSKSWVENGWYLIDGFLSAFVASTTVTKA